MIDVGAFLKPFRFQNYLPASRTHPIACTGTKYFLYARNCVSNMRKWYVSLTDGDTQLIMDMLFVRKTNVERKSTTTGSKCRFLHSYFRCSLPSTSMDFGLTLPLYHVYNTLLILGLTFLETLLILGITFLESYYLDCVLQFVQTIYCHMNITRSQLTFKQNWIFC